jgi:deoxyhypusine synthase
LEQLYLDPKRQTIILGLAGSLIAAGLRNVIRDLIVYGYVDVVVSTGAILYQDIYQARGYQHYQGSPAADDCVLRDLYIDHIYDTYVDEEKFWETDKWCGQIADELGDVTLSSRQYMDHLGSKLTDEDSIVYQCHKNGIPIFCPALNDSSIGIGLTHHIHRMCSEQRTGVIIDSIKDNYELTQIVVNSPGTAAIYVAGGVPKNFINDSVVMSYIFGLNRGHDYAVQLTTAVVHDGGLSSSTLGEARSWGKVAKDATHAMAWIEPSVSLPLIAAYLFSRFIIPGRSKLIYKWQDGILKQLRAK